MPETLEPKDGGVVEKSLVLRLIILGYYDTAAELAAAHPTGADGDCYKVGDNLYIWGTSTGSWVDIGRLKGDAGESSYLHIRYAAVANPTDAQISTTPNDYIGICVNMVEAAPATASSYTWYRFSGDISGHDTDANAHSTTELPWIDGGAVTRAGDSAITLAGDQTAKYPIGKRLRFNASDAYLCRVFGAPTYSGGVTTIAVWFDAASAVIPATISKFERSKLMPQDTADSRLMLGAHDEATVQKLLASYCCGGYLK